MIHITQLIYIVPGEEETFDEFESIAIPIISAYNGRLTLRIRPNDTSFIEHHIEKPYEVHFVEFETEVDFQNFMKDEGRRKFLHLKEKSIKASVLFKGERL